MISVVIPFHNPGEFLSQALECVSLNRVDSMELILVDDGSEQPIEVPGARMLRQAQAAPSAARNAGARLASHSFLAFLDVDDLWEPGSLIHLLRVLQQNERADIAQGKMRQRLLSAVPGHYPRRYDALPHYGVNLGACLFRRSCWESMRGLDEGLRFGEDADFMIRAWHLGVEKVRLPELVLTYQFHGGNMTLQAPSDDKTLRHLLLRQAKRVRSGFPSRTQAGLGQYLGEEPPPLIGDVS